MKRHVEFPFKKAKRKNLLRSKHGWENDIKMDVKEAGYEGMDWIHPPHGRQEWQTLENTVVMLQVPINVRQFFDHLSDCSLLKNGTEPSVQKLASYLSQINSYLMGGDSKGY
jgi:hypothetical protein